jgi:tetratricopeptide (TPR) repeat protein
MMSRRSTAIWLFILLWASFSSAQDPFNSIGSTTGTMTTYESRNGGAILVVTVYGPNGSTKLDRQAVVKATNASSHMVQWQTTDDHAVAPMELISGAYEIEVSAVGYLTEVKKVNAAQTSSTIQISVSLRPDPSAMDLHIAEADMPSKARKDAKQAVSALKSGKLKDAKKRLVDADKLAPSNADLNYLLGYLSYQEKDLVHAQSYLTSATNINHRHLAALTLLGRVALTQEDYPTASSALEAAIDVSPDYWLAHSLLADVYLRQKKYEKAKEQAELALHTGKPGSDTANLTLGQALVNLGKYEEGVKALKAFMHDSPKNPAVPQVQDLITSVEARMADPARNTEAARKNAVPLAGVDPLLASTDLPLSVKSWQPKGIDEEKPAVAAGVNCPYDEVMEKSGDRVKDLVNDVSRIAATEHLIHEQMDQMGNAATRETRSYNYVASISEPKPGFLQVDEDRAERLTRFDYPDQISSSGFMALALVFHPSMRENFETTCEGLGRWHGQAAWLVHFKQREDRPARMHDYRVGGDLYSLHLKGRAWITADKFQIVRIESELVTPMPQIQLHNEQQVVEYGPVQFRDKNMELWLPQKAEIYLDIHKRHYYRSHTFDHYMLFSIDSEEKRNEPKVPPADSNDKPVVN